MQQETSISTVKRAIWLEQSSKLSAKNRSQMKDQICNRIMRIKHEWNRVHGNNCLSVELCDEVRSLNDQYNNIYLGALS